MTAEGKILGLTRFACALAKLGIVQGRVSPAWDSIRAPRHLFLLLTNLFHSLTAYEVRAPSHVPNRQLQCACDTYSL